MSQPVAIPHHRAAARRPAAASPGRFPHKTALAVLAAALVAIAFAFAERAPGLASPGAAEVASSEAPPEYPQPELSPEWRWEPAPVPYRHMYPSRPSYRDPSSRRLDWIRPNGR